MTIMKPRILILGPPKKAAYFAPYLEAVRGVGGDPELAWPGAGFRGEEKALRAFLGKYRGVLFPGGADVEPRRYGEEAYENPGPTDPELDEGQFAVMKLVLSGALPALAICRGLQILGVAAGGALYQDIPSRRPSDVRHSVPHPKDFPAHAVRLREGSVLARLSGALEFEVNSRHHQAVREGGAADRIGPLEIVARAADGLIEGLEHPAHPFLVAVQWHPENLAAGHAPSKGLFEGFVAACRE
jgi:putative glutamine amidotransferase